MNRIDTRRFAVAVPAALIFWSTAGVPAAGDWPTYRGDSHRSGVSSESLKPPLATSWVHRATHPPRPAWPEAPARRDVFRGVGLGPTVVFDRAPHVVVQGESLYYGSSADDRVYCLDVATGETRWSFCTEGPVRPAPTVASGRVYAPSDDGCLWCLDAADGKLLWKYRAGPADRRLPGNGRMISLWPVRCGVIVDDGTVYLCAGLFPSQGAYLCALDAGDGGEIWKRQVDISAQGYLVASPRRLFVPTGRTPPHVYERADGTQVAAFPGGGQQKSGTPEGGGCFAVLVEDQLMHAGGEKGGIQITDATSREKIVWTSGLRLVADGPTAYILNHDRLTALDRSRHIELARLKEKKKKTAEDEKRIAELEGDRKTWLKWEVPCSASYELIMAGDVIFVGEENRVVAYAAADGKQLWTGRVEGKAYSLAVSGGQLFVGTDVAAVHCFKHDVSRTRATEAVRDVVSLPYPEDQSSPLYRRAAETAAGAADGQRGYCLVLGANVGRLAYEIAKRSELQVVGVEPDADKVAEARERLAGAGLYGSRIVIHQGDLDRLPYQQRFANLIVSDETLVSGKMPPSASEVYRVLRPSGGVVVLAQPPGASDPEAMARWAAGVIPGWKVEAGKQGGAIGIARRGPVPGAGEWTHLYADSGNSACSGDALPPGPVDVQWFGRPGPRRMVDRHEKNVGPLYKDGRLFISGDDYIVAVDAYNGTVLWEHDLPRSIRLGALKNCGSMVATDDCLYVAAADGCVGFDVRTGERRRTFPIPEHPLSERSEWGYVASVGDLLFGSATKPGATFRVQDVDTQTLIWRDEQPVVCSDFLFALDRHTGKTLWTYVPEQGVLANPAIAVGGGRVYCIESTNSRTRSVAIGRAPADGRVKLDMLLGEGSNLVALDVSSGKILWRRPADLREIRHVLFLSYAHQTLVVTGTKNVPVAGEMRVRYDLSAFDAATGSLLWQSTRKPVPDHILDGPHGEQVQHSAIVGQTIYNTGFALDLRTGESVPGWKWEKSDKCGTVSTSALCAFSRYSNARMFSLKTGQYTELTSVTRPGCWINIIPAGGLVLIPEASSGCTCYYSVQTSIALAPRDVEP